MLDVNDACERISADFQSWTCFAPRQCDQCQVIKLHSLFLTYEIDADLLSTQMEDKEGSKDHV